MRHLPHSVLAIFYHQESGDAARAASEAAFFRFLNDYRLTPRDAPLLEYSDQWGAQFRCVQCS